MGLEHQLQAIRTRGSAPRKPSLAHLQREAMRRQLWKALSSSPLLIGRVEVGGVLFRLWIEHTALADEETDYVGLRTIVLCRDENLFGEGSDTFISVLAPAFDHPIQNARPLPRKDFIYRFFTLRRRHRGQPGDDNDPPPDAFVGPFDLRHLVAAHKDPTFQSILLRGRVETTRFE